MAFHTLGCKLNFAETSAIGKQLSDEGFTRVRNGEEADVCIINTCTVTDIADRKSRQAIHRLRRQHPNAFMIVTGCYAQLKPEEIASIQGVDLVLGSNEKFDILHHLRAKEDLSKGEVYHTQVSDINEFKPSCSRDDRTRYFLKIQDGCDYVCTYCTIPMARGKSRNGSVDDTVKQAETAIAEGAKEIVLTGVNIGEFKTGKGEKFFDLVRALDELPYNVRFRISSIEPNLLTDEIISFVASSKRFMPHFHIPLQSGSDEVLKIMKRRYKTDLFAGKIAKIKEIMPHAFIGVDVIVGTRGETNELFRESYGFLESLDFSQLHVFTYSERAGTKMVEMEHEVPLAERKKRSETLHQLSDMKLSNFYNNQLGTMAKVLWESRKKGDRMTGFTENYIRVERDYDRSLVNSVETVKLKEFDKENMAVKPE